MIRKLALVFWLVALLSIACRTDSTASKPDAGGHKLGGVYPQKVGDFWVNETAVTPFALKDTGGVTRDTFETVHGRITAGGGGTDYKALIGPDVGVETLASALWLLGNATSATANNYAVNSDGTSTTVNAPGGGNIDFFSANSVFISRLNSTIFQLNVPTQSWTNTVASPLIAQAGATTDVATQNLTIQAMAPYASATGSNRNPGTLIINSPAPTAATGFNGGFLMQTGGTTAIRMGWYGGNDQTYSGIWFRDAGSPSSTNFGFLGNQTFTYLNTVNGGDVRLSMGAQPVVDITGGSNLAANTSITGSMQYTTRSTTSNVTIDTTTTDNFVIVDTSGGAVTVTLPTPTNGRWLTIIDKKNSFGTNACTLARHASEKIDNVASSKILNASGYRGNIVSDGTDWYTMFVLPPLFLLRRRRGENDNDDAFKEAA